jgi:hypothetical protein
MKHLIKHKDGSVAIMHLASDDYKVSDEIAKWDPIYQDRVLSYCALKEEILPKDNYFRDAWIHEGDEINIDLEKAKEIHRLELRRLRKSKLERLDIKYMRASETGDEERKKEVIALKQYLRDITQSPELLNAKTHEEVKNFMPDILKET